MSQTIIPLDRSVDGAQPVLSSKLTGSLPPSIPRPVSPLLLTPALLPRVQTILDASFATTNAATLYAVHPSTSASTIFLSGADLAKFVHSLGKEVTEVDFAPMQTPEGEKKPEKKAEKKVEEKSAG